MINFFFKKKFIIMITNLQAAAILRQRLVEAQRAGVVAPPVIWRKTIEHVAATSPESATGWPEGPGRCAEQQRERLAVLTAVMRLTDEEAVKVLDLKLVEDAESVIPTLRGYADREGATAALDGAACGQFVLTLDDALRHIVPYEKEKEQTPEDPEDPEDAMDSDTPMPLAGAAATTTAVQKQQEVPEWLAAFTKRPRGASYPATTFVKPHYLTPGSRRGPTG